MPVKKKGTPEKLKIVKPPKEKKELPPEIDDDDGIDADMYVEE